MSVREGCPVCEHSLIVFGSKVAFEMQLPKSWQTHPQAVKSRASRDE